MRNKALEILKVLAFLGFLGLWTFLVLAWTGSFVRAETLSKEHFREIFRRSVVKALPWPEEDIEVVRLSAEPVPLEVPEGVVEKIRLTDLPRPGSNTVLVDYLKDGRLVARVRILGYVEVRVPVVVLRHPVPRGAILSTADLAVEKRPLTRLPQDVLSSPEEAVGKRVRYGLPAGRPLRASQIEVPPVIRRNQIVKIVARSRFLTVIAKGQARQDGRPGEIIRVRNLSSKREIYARVVSPEIVEVTF